jgi:DinB superfamily
MNKTELISLLETKHEVFIQLMEGLSAADFEKRVTGKWTPGQQLEHILRSVSPVSLAFSLPGFLLRIFFGKANRPSRSYEELVAKYHAALSKGGRASGRFEVKNPVPIQNRNSLITALKRTVLQLSRLSTAKSEAALDNYILPHPLLGKLTLREMLYFTAYHVQHHQCSVQDIVSTQTETT